MYLEKIQFRNFRNLQDVVFSPSPGFNILIGNNAQGKTNIIESIYMFAHGRSFRTSEFRDLVAHGQLISEVKLRACGRAGFDDLALRMDDGKKEFFKNEKKIRVGIKSPFSAVIFAPEEILLLKGPPSGRRKYLDLLVNQVSPTHMTLVRKCERVILQRNGIIQNEDLSKFRKLELLGPWDEQLVLLGAKIIDERSSWLKKLGRILPEKYRAIASNDGEAAWKYIPQCGADVLGFERQKIETRLFDLIKSRRDDEFSRKTTLVGPHRDDLEALIGGVCVKSFGSQGQHRTFVLALKIAEIEFLKAETGCVPILLLDDVMSELDSDRNNYLFDYLKMLDGQAFITTTSNNEAIISSNRPPFIFDVAGGNIIPRKRQIIAVCASPIP